MNWDLFFGPPETGAIVPLCRARVNVKQFSSLATSQLRSLTTGQFSKSEIDASQQFGLIDEPLSRRLLFFRLAALIVISFLLSWRDSDQGGLGDEESTSEATDDEE